MKVTIVEIGAHSPHRSDIIQLGHANKRELGFLPVGAFDEAAKKGTLLGALDQTGNCAGYLLYRRVLTKQRAAITHLCVSQEHRARGIARKLVEDLKNRTQDLRGISVFSRRDLESNSFWRKVGFLYRGEKLGRGEDRIPLTHYWYDHGHPDLFAWADARKLQSRSTQAVLDANVFFALQDDPSHPLLGNWLLEDVVFSVTPELFHEINRGEDPARRVANLEYAQAFPLISGAQEQFHAVCELLRDRFLKPEPSESDESDVLHLAYAIVGGADFFVTNDIGLVKTSRDMSDEFEVSVVHPDDFIVFFDELRHASEYRLNRLAGSLVRIRRVGSGETDMIARVFQAREHEKKSHLAGQLREFLVYPRVYETLVVQGESQEPMALVVHARTQPLQLDVPLIRLGGAPGSPGLAAQLVMMTVAKAVAERRCLVRITDSNTCQTIVQALHSSHFEPADGNWIKFGFRGVFGVEMLCERLEALAEDYPELASLARRLVGRLRQVARAPDLNAIVRVERTLWPAKIAGVDIPTFAVAIRPAWAMDLFDARLGAQTLFESDPNLVFKLENAYYRSAYQKLPTAPSRVLWYVTRGQHRGTKAIRACSYVDEVVIGTPKDLFRRFDRMGVYRWRNVFEAAKGDVNRKILAFRFSGTELFDRPVPLDQLKEILDRQSAFQSPTRVSVADFEKIYGIGLGLEGA